MAKKKKKRTKKILIVAVIVLIVGGLIAANALKPKDASLEVTTEKVKRGRLVQTVPGTGRIQPEVQVNISANVSGEITKIFVKEGDRVKKGDPLVVLDRERYKAAVEQAQSSLKSAQASLAKSGSDLRRVEELYQQGLASQAELESAQADFQYRSAEVERARAYLKQAQDDLAKTTIFSPMDGVISLLNKEPGEMALGAQFQQDIIMVVADLNRMEVEVEVDESDIINVSLQDTALIKIDAFPDTTFKGTVREIAHTATTRGLGTAEEITNFLVKITLLEIPKGLRPGMSATADIITDVRENTLYVPIQCVVLKPPLPESENADSARGESGSAKTDQRNPDDERVKKHIEVVFKVVDNVVQQTPVVTGITSDMDIEILSGLEEGDIVVSGPYRTLTQKLKHGDSVKIKGGTGRESRKRRGGPQADAELMDEM